MADLQDAFRRQEEGPQRNHGRDRDHDRIDEHRDRHGNGVPRTLDLRFEQQFLGDEAEERRQPRH